MVETGMLRLIDAAVAADGDDRAFYLRLVADAVPIRYSTSTGTVDATDFLVAACATITVAIELVAKLGGTPRDELYAAVREWCLSDRRA